MTKTKTILVCAALSFALGLSSATAEELVGKPSGDQAYRYVQFLEQQNLTPQQRKQAADTLDQWMAGTLKAPPSAAPDVCKGVAKGCLDNAAKLSAPIAAAGDPALCAVCLTACQGVPWPGNSACVALCYQGPCK